MGKDFYIGDWHYGHRNILKYDDRPFLNIDDMNAVLIHKWNARVTGDDTVYVLGDMFWTDAGEAVEVLDCLAGEKVLIKGNHDNLKDKRLRSRFVSVHDYLEHKDKDKNVVLCHYPMPCFKNHFHGWYHLYAHVHNSFEWHMMEHCKREMTDLYEKPCNMFNVGVMMPWMDYAPQTLDDILKGAKKYEEATYDR